MKTEEKEFEIYVLHDDDNGEVVIRDRNLAGMDKDIFNYTLLDAKTLSIAIPIIDPAKSIELQVESLRRAQEKIRAESTAKINNINESIQNLLCITHDGGEA